MNQRIMKELECPSCGSRDDYYASDITHTNCTNCMCVISFTDCLEEEKTEINNDWKDLDIGNIPSDLYKGNYEIQFLASNSGNWFCITSSIGKALDDLNCNRFKYRYRLKPLESMRVSQSVLNVLNGSRQMLQFDRDDNGLIIAIDGRKVEIIEE